jgi:hypothetical protein
MKNSLTIINIIIVISCIILNIFSKNFSALIAWCNTGLWIILTIVLQKRIYKQQDEIGAMWTENIDFILSRFKINEIERYLRKKKLEKIKKEE